MATLTEYGVMVKVYRGEKEGDRWIGTALPLPYHYWTSEKDIAEQVAKEKSSIYGEDKVKIQVRQRTKETFQKHLKKRFTK